MTAIILVLINCKKRQDDEIFINCIDSQTVSFLDTKLVGSKLYKTTPEESVLIPVVIDKESAGVLEVFHSEKGKNLNVQIGDLRYFSKKLSQAINTDLQEYKTMVQSVILEKYTGIHPAVKWSFEDAAIDFIKKKTGGSDGIRDIEFRRIYPFYSISDIRGSSKLRNQSIQSDLIDQLNQVKTILQIQITESNSNIYKELLNRVNTKIDHLEHEILVHDEFSILLFYKQKLREFLIGFMIQIIN